MQQHHHEENNSLSWLVSHIWKLMWKFDGRISRGEYILVGAGYGIISALIQYLATLVDGFYSDRVFVIFFAVLMVIVGFLMLYSMLVRRFHDLGKSGWYAWLLLIPLVNIYWGIILIFNKSQEGTNQYGEDPLLRQPKSDGLYWLLFIIATVISQLINYYTTLNFQMLVN